MKVVINACYGGFSISRKAVARMAELQGRPCFFFTFVRDAGRRPSLDAYVPASEDGDDWMVTAFDIPNPNEVLAPPDGATWAAMTMEQRQAHNALYRQHEISNRPDERHDPSLVRVVEELGKDANGAHAELRVVEIPDGVEYVIDEYDGNEHIAEQHRTWR